MRKKNQEIKDVEIIEKILTQSKICRIAMLDGDLPYLLPFNYGYLDKRIYIHAAPEGKKINIIEKNPVVCFEIEDYDDIIPDSVACKWASRYRSIVGYAKVEILRGPKEIKEGLDIIMNHNGASGPYRYEDKHLESVVILKLKIDSISCKKSGNWDRLHKQALFECESENFLFKEINMTDIKDIHALHSLEEIDEFNTLGIPENLAESETILRSLIEAQLDIPRKSYTWKLLIKNTDEFAGLAGMTMSKDRFNYGEIYYKLLPKFWGKGYATEIAKEMIRFGFEDFSLHRIEAGVATENSRSIRVLEKAGMKREGLMRKILPIRGKWVDNYHYAIVEDD